MNFGILTSGGDTPGMNTVIKSIYRRCKHNNHNLICFSGGWKGLLDNNTIKISETILDEIDLGGTILGSGRTNPLKEDDGIEKIKQTLEKNGIEAMIAIGGEDTLGVANELFKAGLPMIGIPKTIDNDLDCTDYTFGFNTAITIATEAMDRLHSTAKSHNRVIVVEIMGRHAGWMTLHSGIAAGAHMILIPEYSLSKAEVIDIMKKRYAKGDTWGIVAVSEGYSFTKNETEDMEKDEFGHILLDKLDVAQSIADLLKNELGITTRAIKLGHVQRGGSPTVFDRVLCTQLGFSAYDLAIKKEFGKMPALQGIHIVPVDLSQAVARLKTVDEQSWNVARKLMGMD